MFERSMKKSLAMQIVAACTLGALASQASSCIAATLRALQWPSSSRQVAGLPETRDDGVFRDAFDAPPYRIVGTTRVYDDRSAFLAAVELDAFDNHFDDLSTGASGELRYTGADFAYAITTEFRARSLLYNGPGFVSTAAGQDQIAVFSLLSGREITAIGADFWSSDFSLQPDIGDIEIDVADAVEIIPAGASNTFRGFITHDPLVALFVEAPDPVDSNGVSHDRWPTMDNLVVGVAR